MLLLVCTLPVAISMIGKHLSAGSVLFIGWFDQRGLASLVLGLVVMGQGGQSPGVSLARLGLITTMLLSLFAHGLSASAGK